MYRLKSEPASYKTTTLDLLLRYDKAWGGEVQCTVNGERNSGTTFLAELLRKHGLTVFDGLCVYKLQLAWKHDFPGPELKLVGENVVNFFIVRKLENWLITTHNKPHHLGTFGKPFPNFLTEKQTLCTHWTEAKSIKTNKQVNHYDENKTIFEIRYEKLKAYLRYFNENKNVVIVSLEYLQDENNCKHFLREISNKYGFEFSTIVGSVDKHVKTGEIGVKNVRYETKITQVEEAIINSHKDKELEKFVNTLTFVMK